MKLIIFLRKELINIIFYLYNSKYIYIYIRIRNQIVCIGFSGPHIGGPHHPGHLYSIPFPSQLFFPLFNTSTLPVKTLTKLSDIMSLCAQRTIFYIGDIEILILSLSWFESYIYYQFCSLKINWTMFIRTIILIIRANESRAEHIKL